MAREKFWTDVITVDQLETGWVTPVTLGARKLAVYDTPSGVYTSMALCNHGGADMCNGYFDGHVIECPLHQGAFDVRDGKPVSPPATRPMITFETRTKEGTVQIKI
ncbi:MAG: non-heme iron oxygenase ferredoxin subunit [Tateyamaria sp.]|uniref:non-heme iron oxygenase ferredoxin subunit n=1 Tax=Tateyamaria sp. TaxID=1929288 RepID=UPI00328C810C